MSVHFNPIKVLSYLQMNAITTTYVYIQFIVHLLTLLLVHQVAQRVKLNIDIEEQTKNHERQALVVISALYFKERRATESGN